LGWVLKGFLVIVALLLLVVGLWWATGIIFVYLVLSSAGGRRKVGRAVLVAPGATDGAPLGYSERRRGGLKLEWRWRYLLGGALLVGAFLGLSAHGTFSPLAFGVLAALCFLWAPLSKAGRAPAVGYAPLRESTLLRSAVFPFEWMSVAEVKLSSRESARALSVLHDTLIVVAPPSERPSAYLVVKQVAVGYRSAEARISERLRKLGSALASRGVYLMPLDSMEAARRFRPSLEPVETDLNRGSALETVGHSPYDVLVLKPDGAHAKSFGAYRETRSAAEAEVERIIAGEAGQTVGAELTASGGKMTLPSARQQFERAPLLWEVVSCLQERFRFSDPDGYTMFLNNMHLSRGVEPGQKITLAGGAAEGRSNSSTLTVESLGGAPVEMTRAQLRTIVKMYG
jgi:hypothetical protein